MDLITADKRLSVFAQRASEIRQKCAGAGWDNVRVFSTSIWDETLYSAWSDIVSTLNPHVGSLATYLSRFAHLCSASEVVLFEKTTMLVISQSFPYDQDPELQSPIKETSSSGEEEDHWPEDRFARISQAIKLFRVVCLRLKSEFSSMEIKQHTYTAIFDAFTPKTYILVITTNGTVGPSELGTLLKSP